ncbi:hypothetical protein [Nocardia australiensis]|uniref:hypothetical protein n=1 Tax=Nocardia australiensis TaxID=2887191 RepID=UPI001D13E43F|nr:hypothetical protein [Nocardia australiensis]
MIDIGALVKTTPASDRTFTITEIDDTVALITPVGETAPGSYPYWWPLRWLHPVGV